MFYLGRAKTFSFLPQSAPTYGSQKPTIVLGENSMVFDETQ
jgi:hypothetical protein